MNKPIQAGDLVQVIRPSACPVATSANLGHIFVVDAILTEKEANSCRYCGAQNHGDHLYAFEKGPYVAWGLRRLKRIPPLEELEGEKHDERIEA